MYDKFLKELKKATNHHKKETNPRFSFRNFKSKNKNTININVIITTKGSDLKSNTLRTILNLVSTYRYELEGNNSNRNYDSKVFYLSEDFEKTLERRYYSNRLGH